MGECQRRYAGLCHILEAFGRNEALMEAVVKQARTTRHPWLVACDANMDPEDFKKSSWYKCRCMLIEAPGEGISTCRSRSLNGELIERTYDYVIACHSLQENIKNMELREDFESRPHRTAIFW